MSLIFNAHLQRCPFADEITQAGALPPQISTQDDFIAYAAFAKPTWAPVLLTFEQKYRLMDAVLAEVRRTLEGEFRQLLMTCRVPGVTRFPTAYNSEDIFKVSDLTVETQRLIAFGIPFLTMHEGFIRHPMEKGENEFRLELHQPGAVGKSAFQACVEALTALGLEENFSV